MRYFAYCPMDNVDASIWAEAKRCLNEGQVVIVSKYGVTIVPYRGNSANAYGYDLYLIQIDASGNETQVGTGSFN